MEKTRKSDSLSSISCTMGHTKARDCPTQGKLTAFVKAYEEWEEKRLGLLQILSFIKAKKAKKPKGLMSLINEEIRFRGIT